MPASTTRMWATCSPGPIPACGPTRTTCRSRTSARAGRLSTDGLTWTFHLQKDKKWSDGEPITADDWVFTLQRFARARLRLRVVLQHGEHRQLERCGQRQEAAGGAGRQEGGRLHLHRDDRSADAVPGQDLRRSLGRAQAHRQGSPERRLVGLRQGELGLRRAVQAGELGQGQGDGLCRQRQVHRPLPADDGQDHRHLHGRPRRAGRPTRTASWTPSAAATRPICRHRPWPRSWPTRS